MSSNAVTEGSGQDVAAFEPQAAKARDVQTDGVITMAKKLRLWPELENAVDEKVKNIIEIRQWWQANVRRKGGAGGYQSENADQHYRYAVEEAEELTGIKQPQIAKWGRLTKDADTIEKFKAMLFGAAYQKAMAEANNTTATKWTGDPESYTPREYIEAARAVMGGIDLDPASNALAQKTVRAAKWFSETDDGLKQNWDGRVFLNPPYAYPAIEQFITKLCDEGMAGGVAAAILLTNNNTDTKWWHLAAYHAAAVCFTAGRINFYKADGSITQPTNGQTFFYFGPDADAFRQTFSEYGFIMAGTGDGN